MIGINAYNSKYITSVYCCSECICADNFDISACFRQSRQPVQLLAAFNFIPNPSHILNIYRPVRRVFDLGPQM